MATRKTRNTETVTAPAPAAPSAADLALARELERELYRLADDPDRADEFEAKRLELSKLRGRA